MRRFFSLVICRCAVACPLAQGLALYVFCCLSEMARARAQAWHSLHRPHGSPHPLHHIKEPRAGTSERSPSLGPAVVRHWHSFLCTPHFGFSSRCSCSSNACCAICTVLYGAWFRCIACQCIQACLAGPCSLSESCIRGLGLLQSVSDNDCTDGAAHAVVAPGAQASDGTCP